MGDIRVIVKRPNELYGHTVNISNDLKTFQGIVEGYIETITILNSPRVIMVVNDEGKLQDHPENFTIGSWIKDTIHGTVILCGAEGEEFADVPIDMTTWKRMLVQWGN